MLLNTRKKLCIDFDIVEHDELKLGCCKASLNLDIKEKLKIYNCLEDYSELEMGFEKQSKKKPSYNSLDALVYSLTGSKQVIHSP